MIIFYLYQDLAETKDGKLIPKEIAGGLRSLNLSLGAFTIKEGKLIILKSRNEITNNIINTMFTGLNNL